MGEGERLVSTLLINNAVEADAGLYSCSLGVFSHRLFPKARANVHVIQGDRLAVQGGAPQQSQHWHKVLLETWVMVSLWPVYNDSQCFHNHHYHPAENIT